MNPKNILAETTDNRTYRIAFWHYSGLCCKNCQRRGRHKWYYYYNKPYSSTSVWRNKKVEIGEGRYPNWKLTSKNSKQWMKKKLVYKTRWNNWEKIYSNTTDISW